MTVFFNSIHFSSTGFEFLISLFIYFSFFCTIGWFIELCYLSTTGKGFINSGFLQGPFIAAYATGVIIIYPFTVLLFSQPLWLQCIFYAVLATLIEFIAHFFLEKVMGIRIWDYSDEFLNFQGRISLKYSFFWFLLVLFLVTILQPIAILFIESIGERIRFIIATIYIVVLLVDFGYSIYIFSHFSQIIKTLCTTFNLPIAEMNELQFNRPRIINEKQRIEKLFNDSAYSLLNSRVEEVLFLDKSLMMSGINGNKFEDIIDNPAYKLWRTSTEEAEKIFYTHYRIAEIGWKFASKLNLDAEKTVRGILLAAYQSNAGTIFDKIRDLFFPQLRILINIKKDFKVLSKIEKDIIMCYKWPLNLLSPKTSEGFIVSFAAKIITSKEFRHVTMEMYKPIFE